MQLAPIVLFVYNRPEHTRRVVEALRQNPLAEQSDLLIFSDGPRHESDRPKVAAVRKILASISGFRRVEISESMTNRGLATSIIEGVTRVVHAYGRVIVLEDDLLTSPWFLSYMNEALDCYADNPQVMHVNGYWYPVGPGRLPETFFLRMPFSWGWATWSRAWTFFEKDSLALVNGFSQDDIHRFNLDGAYDAWEQVRHNLQGKANTWAVFWYASVFKCKGLCLYPSQSLTQNLGHDGTGVHCLKTSHYDVILREAPISSFSCDYTENKLAFSMLQTFYQDHRISRLHRFVAICWLRLMRTIENYRDRYGLL